MKVNTEFLQIAMDQFLPELAMAEKNHITEEPLPDYEKASINLLKEGLKCSYKERFQMATRLYKIQQSMQKAVITHKKSGNSLCGYIR